MRHHIVCLLVAAACHAPANHSPDAAPSPDASPDAAAPVAVAFSYTPSWSGVKSITVTGGTSTDMTTWTTLATLASGGATWSGTAMLAPGTYYYLFATVGDAAAGAMSATKPFAAVDPSQSSFGVCPTAMGEMNTCTQITVPQSAAPAPSAMTGKILVGGTAAPGFLVLLERDEPNTHHTFVDRTDSAADGSFAFSAAPGTYRFQIQHPQFEAKNDSQLAPATLGILRRNISSAFTLAAAKSFANVDMAYTSYAQLQPQPGTTQQALPTTFTFPTGAGTRLDIYGGAKEIGDPWYNAPATAGTAAFASPGTFAMPPATQPMVVAGTQYWWGIEVVHAPDASGLAWTNQSMVFPITWSN